MVLLGEKCYSEFLFAATAKNIMKWNAFLNTFLFSNKKNYCVKYINFNVIKRKFLNFLTHFPKNIKQTKTQEHLHLKKIVHGSTVQYSTFGKRHEISLVH